MPRIFIIACEASGDKHGADLVRALQKLDSTIQFEGLGGSEMKQAGVRLLEEMTRISALGFGDVLKKYFLFRKIFYRALGHVKKTKPDQLILIDSPAFNLRFAKKIKRQIPVIYYISPQIWAWGARRIHTIRKTVDHMIVILPFEEEIYRRAGIPCTFVGHPLLDRVKPTKPRANLREEFKVKPQEKVVMLLPGSREPEVRRILPIMMKSAQLLQKEMKGIRFFMAQTAHVPGKVYDSILCSFPDVSMTRSSERLYDRVHLADFAWVASGTATLETALMGTPFFLLYKASASTFFIGRRLVKIPYIGLVNVLAGRHVVPEFIQHLAQPSSIVKQTKTLLENDALRENFKWEIQAVLKNLGEPGASERAARIIVTRLKNQADRTSGGTKLSVTSSGR